MRLETRIRRVVADWLYSGRSGSGDGPELLIAALVAELKDGVTSTDHNAKIGVMASDDVMPTSCDWCGSADHLIHHCPDMERDGREAGAREAAADKSDWPL